MSETAFQRFKRYQFEAILSDPQLVMDVFPGYPVEEIQRLIRELQQLETTPQTELDPKDVPFVEMFNAVALSGFRTALLPMGRTLLEAQRALPESEFWSFVKPRTSNDTTLAEIAIDAALEELP